MKKTKAKKEKCCHKFGHNCSGGCTYFMGFLGAVIYFISTATGFWSGVLGVLKAIIWPLILVFEVLKFMGA